MSEKTVDTESVISAGSNSEQKKILEGRWLETLTVTDIDEEEFEGMWDSVPYIIPVGGSKTFPAPLADHLTASLASKMLTRAGLIPSDNIAKYQEYCKKIQGLEVVDYSSMTYEELIASAEAKGTATVKKNGKPMTKSELWISLSNAK